jgi:hypothetical protein
MALVYLAAKKWKRLHFSTRSRKRWLLIWGYLGLLEAVLVAGLLWAAYFPEPVPGWAGAAAWTVLHPFPLYNILVLYLLGLLFEAIGETTIGVALAAMVWWIFSLFSEPSKTPRTIAPAQRYSIALLASACILGIANRIYALRPPTCFDCFAPHGFPFTYFHEGGLAGGGGFVWSGVAGDTLLIFAVGVIVGWIWNRASQNHSLKAVNS